MNVQTEPKLSRGSRRFLVVGLLVAVVVGLAAVGGVLAGVIRNPFHRPVQAGPAAPTDFNPTAKTIRPKRESSVSINIEQLATVEPYYRADLRARASGIVQSVLRDIGDKVHKGELLIQIDVPESDQDVGRSEAMILQREQELKVSKAKLKDATAAMNVSAATIKQRKADVQAAVATRDLKKRRFERFKDLAEKGSVVGNVVEEEERDFLSSEAAVTSANANVERAQADHSESESRVEGAAADIDLKKAQIEVARKDLDRAKAIAEYARITAPFDGVIVKRTVDPGSFVQNATTGASEPLISVSRVDLVTVSAKFPDSVAPFVQKHTAAIVQVDDLPGVTIPAAISRFAPSVQNADHTMRVEVDLFNGDDAEYERLSAAIAKGGPERATKGMDDPMPVRAFPAGKNNKRLIPGMTGKVRLSLGGFGESYVLPSTAMYTRGGAAYVMVIENGKTREIPVRVQINDGKTVRVALAMKQTGTDGSTREVLQDLTGAEEVVAARQMEFGDGASVKTSPGEW